MLGEAGKQMTSPPGRFLGLSNVALMLAMGEPYSAQAVHHSTGACAGPVRLQRLRHNTGILRWDSFIGTSLAGSGLGSALLN